MMEESNDEQFYRDTESIGFTKLDDRQLGLLGPLGKRRTLRHGECTFKAGQRDLGLTIISAGDRLPGYFRGGRCALRLGEALRRCCGRSGMAIAGVHDALGTFA